MAKTIHYSEQCWLRFPPLYNQKRLSLAGNVLLLQKMYYSLFVIIINQNQSKTSEIFFFLIREAILRKRWKVSYSCCETGVVSCANTSNKGSKICSKFSNAVLNRKIRLKKMSRDRINLLTSCFFKLKFVWVATSVRSVLLLWVEIDAVSPEVLPLKFSETLVHTVSCVWSVIKSSNSA